MSFDADPYMSVELAGQDLNTDAWFCLNPDVLLARAPMAGENVKLAGRDGRLARRKFADEQTVDLQFVITGNDSGTSGSSPEARLAVAKRSFGDTYYGASKSTTTVVCRVTDIDGSVFQGPVQVGPPQFGEGLYETTAVMSVTMTDGELARVT